MSGKSIREWVNDVAANPDAALDDIFKETEKFISEYDAERDATIAALQAELMALKKLFYGYPAFVDKWPDTTELEISNGDTVLLRLTLGDLRRAGLGGSDAPARKFAEGQRVRKIKGSSWQGQVVGFYSTALTPIGYCVESEREPGSVQLYPEAALEAEGGSDA